MAICQFFLKGQCRFGAQCRNEHPKDANPQGPGLFGNQTWTAGRDTTTATATATTYKHTFTPESIKKDLTPNDDKPLWPLSSYGPGKSEATLIQGLDESPEELRLKAWQALKSGDPMQIEAYKSYEDNKIAFAAAAYRNVHDHAEAAFQSAFRVSTAAPAAPATSAFGQQPSTLSAFGQHQPLSAFSQLAKPPTASAFGQPSVFGQPSSSAQATSTSVFGQPSFGQPTSVFGQTSQPTPPAFGQPAFGRPSQTQPTSAFGQSAFGQQQQQQPATAPTFGQSAFGQQQAPQRTSAFGQPSPASAFGVGGAGASTGGGFSAFAGKPAVFGQQQQQQPLGGGIFGPAGGGTSPSMGADSAVTMGINGGAPALAPPQSAFGVGGTGSAFGVGGTGSAFSIGNGGGAPTAPGSVGSMSAFGNPVGASSFMGAGAPGSTFGVQATPPPVTMTDGAGPSISASVSARAQPPPLDFRPGSGRSAFVASADPYAAKLPRDYMEILPKAVKEAFLREEFEWGQVPEWPPPLETR